MGALDNALNFLTKQAEAGDSFYTGVRDKALRGELGWDDLFKLWAQYSVGSIDRWMGASSVGAGTPLVFAKVGVGTPAYAGEPMTIAPLPLGSKPDAEFIKLKVTNAGATGQPQCTIQPTGHLKLDVNGLANLTNGDLFLIIAYYEHAGVRRTIAQLTLLIG